MDVFGLHRRLIGDYSEFTRSFVDIRDKRIADTVDEAVEDGVLWPDPWLQLNPNYEPGETVDDLVAEGVLHDECGRIFRIKKDRSDHGRPLRLHRHQSEAIRAAAEKANYVLTTGTGSGKSLSYIVPIVDHVLRRGSGSGIRGLIVYPMNALANSQLGELEKFLDFGYVEGTEPVRVRRYTGQETLEERDEILTNPPDIVLTNYVMLELILTRPQERKRLLGGATGKLQYLVLDELHTYRGRQGADVAMLVRRVRDACSVPHLQVVGTSATMASGGTQQEQRREVATVASRLFGAEVLEQHVIGETLQRATPAQDWSTPADLDALRQRLQSTDQPPDDYDAFLADPLSSWIEQAIGLRREGGSGPLLRKPPRPITGRDGAAEELAELTGITASQCSRRLEEHLLAGAQLLDGDERNAFAFRLHQFLTKGDTVYASLEDEDDRYLTLEGQTFRPGNRDVILLPLVFCRECGEEYYCVWRAADGSLTPRDLGEHGSSAHAEAGFLHRDREHPWPEDLSEIYDRLPDSWLRDEGGHRRVDPNRRKDVPKIVHVDPSGQLTDDGLRLTWLPASFRFCLECGISYDPSLRSDMTKLSGLSSEGRSSATSLMSLSLVEGLRRDQELEPTARKLLSFTDNRQDAALQAGHFNDFVEIGLLRGALYRAVLAAGIEGLTSDTLVHAVVDALNLPFDQYAADPTVKFLAKKQTDSAFHEVIGYRLFQDLRRGWRVTLPNLEQTGLLTIAYESLNELAADDDEWQGLHQALVTASPETRAAICQVLLDDLRRNLAINVTYLDEQHLRAVKNSSYDRLAQRWAIDIDERLETSAIAYPRARRADDPRGNRHHIGPRGGFGRLLRKAPTFPEWSGGKLSLDDSEQIIRDLLKVLRTAGLVRVADDDDPAPGYQLVAGAMRWMPGDGEKPYHDRTRTPDLSEHGGRTNPFFVDFYRSRLDDLRGLEAREHTAQVYAQLRMEREEEFREGTLPVLYCSPTMELGVDISQLNAVHLRNVPPTPANYAQRSGRAGRSGQPAIVTTYCAGGSPHDQYFFRRSHQMVAGAVAPPRLDLANRDLIRAHVQAIWLAETRQKLGSSMADVLDLQAPGFPLKSQLAGAFGDPGVVPRARQRAAAVLATVADELADAAWYSDGWLDGVLASAAARFDDACGRWRSLYESASVQAREQSAIAQDPAASSKARERAKRLRAQAEAQLELLTSEATDRYQSDFYPYRYFASEGFLPGYSFPRLPLSAFVPGQRNRNEYLSRPRFLAINEFGPGALVYHEGTRYQIERVIIPVGEFDDEGVLPLRTVKQCSQCGYIHDHETGNGPDVCERCAAQLPAPISNLFRMQNVITRRRQRINSDEEERQRAGFELRSGVRFADDSPPAQTEIRVGEDSVGGLTYGDAATIWRINLGWRRRKDRERYGYVLDLEEGTWLSEDKLQEGDDPLPSLDKAARVERVVPYVEDRRNCLLIELSELADTTTALSLLMAVKQGIQAMFQLEDDELAAEGLPTDDEPRVLLLYEAAEGGAGVLRRLLTEQGALAQVAAAALEICHFDPETGEDRGRAPGARQLCEAACYDCLMSYRNQRHHRLLDRKAIREVLLSLAGAVVPAEAGHDYSSHLEALRQQTDSALEREWLDLVDAHGLALPTHAQKLIGSCACRPDFLYAPDYLAVFIDGPVHDEPSQASLDRQQQDCLEDMGYQALRFRYDDKDGWLDQLAAFPSVFGEVP